MPTLRFDKIEQEMQTGIRRAAVFLGLGVNAANRRDFIEYQLSDDTLIRILPEVPESVVEDWKSGFKTWVIAGAVRELIEHFSIFLDRVFGCVVVLSGETPSVSKARFGRLGLAGKLKMLSDHFGISSGFDDALSTLTPIRNCLIHRLGAVSKADVKDGPLRLCFHAPRIFISSSTIEYDLPQVPIGSGPIEIPEGGEIKLEPFKVYEREFHLGDSISLSPHELHQILFFAEQCMKRILSSAIGFCTSNGAKTDNGEMD